MKKLIFIIVCLLYSAVSVAQPNHYTNEYITSYKATSKPEIINLKAIKYVVIENIVQAESQEAGKAIKALYLLDEKVKLQSKSLKDYYDYNTFPLEGTWRFIKEEIGFREHPKNLIGKFMLKQPLFITEEIFTHAKEEAIKETKDDDINIYLASAELKTIDEGKNIQILHRGPYKDEPKSFKIIEDFMSQNNLSKEGIYHREIYLKDMRSGTPETYETILRLKVK